MHFPLCVSIVRTTGRPAVRCPAVNTRDISVLSEGMAMKLGSKYSLFEWALLKSSLRSEVRGQGHMCTSM